MIGRWMFSHVAAQDYVYQSGKRRDVWDFFQQCLLYGFPSLIFPKYAVLSRQEGAILLSLR